MGKKNKQTWRKKVRVDITALVLNLKPSYLWDESRVTPEEARSFLEEVLQGLANCQADMCTRSALNILTLEDNVFIVSFQSMIDHIDHLSLPSHLDRYFNFVTDLNSAELDQIKCILHSLKEIFQEFQKNQNEKPKIFNLEKKSEWSVTFVWGVLLGYPIILYDPETKTVPTLTNHKVQLKIDAELAKQININCVIPFQHLLYSFSYPVEVSDKFECTITEWYNKLKSRNTISQKYLQKHIYHESTGVIVL